MAGVPSGSLAEGGLQQAGSLRTFRFSKVEQPFIASVNRRMEIEQLSASK